MIEVVAETGSTNADLASRIATGSPAVEGHWLVADRQVAGKGRLGRVWNDGAGNFMGSTVVRLRPGDPAAATLALATGLAVHDALATYVPDGLSLKWPNDVLLRCTPGSSEHGKVAGILLEMVAGAVVVGIGVNLAYAPAVPGRTVMALRDAGVAPNRDGFAERMAQTFAAELDRWRKAGLPPLLRRWEATAHPLGTRLQIHPPGEDAVEGAFAGLSGNGNLQLKLADGTVRLINAGDVVLV
ncbi:biotin--[acetyl-CoA-carboxylase] ligase [Novosphingobium sp. Leaf2]|uniref:biotin--[acetyl-CoA-carboxylase] ligase n=1 Tax=Novosphingobium sp. Leaf2 TaxID=1735670 RepID=UPI0006F323C9|nr:biotin--[acetyl-CoA-carboxylase] ligase [Novosphingobium sp. Leaf2]KQM17386.1 biotin--protein ligase [Novosphingobium sp. Leaf2]